MPRQGRHEEPGAIHHAVLQGNGRRRIVHDDVDREMVFRRLREVEAACEWEELATSLLDTHAHLLVRTAEPNLGRGIGRLLGAYSHWFHGRHGGDGALFRPRFWSRRVTNERQLIRSALYVDLNPVVAGLADHPARYPWGTYARHRPWLDRVFSDGHPGGRDGYGALVDDACARLRRDRLPEAVEGVLETRFGADETG